MLRYRALSSHYSFVEPRFLPRYRSSLCVSSFTDLRPRSISLRDPVRFRHGRGKLVPAPVNCSRNSLVASSVSHLNLLKPSVHRRWKSSRSGDSRSQSSTKNESESNGRGDVTFAQPITWITFFIVSMLLGVLIGLFLMEKKKRETCTFPFGTNKHTHARSFLFAFL
jgi:hypothetical protein